MGNTSVVNHQDTYDFAVVIKNYFKVVPKTTFRQIPGYGLYCTFGRFEKHVECSKIHIINQLCDKLPEMYPEMFPTRPHYMGVENLSESSVDLKVTADVHESTPSLVFDRKTGLVANYYYQRGARKMKRRTVKAADIFDNPGTWPEPTVLAEGHEKRAYDAGNVNATASAGRHYLATYTGTDRDTAVVVLSLEPPRGPVPDVMDDNGTCAWRAVLVEYAPFFR